MRVSSLGVLLLVTGTVLSDEPPPDRIAKHFKSEHFTVAWGTPLKYDLGAELEIGDGGGHGGGLRWLRFRPRSGHVEVLSILLREDREPYLSKWPTDRPQIVIRRAEMSLQTYASLLIDLAVVDAAKLTPTEDVGGISTADCWWFARLATHEQNLLQLEWAGYTGSDEEIKYSKPLVAVLLADQAIKGLEFEKHTLTREDRKWASAKFARDWKAFLKRDFHWWVRERYIMMIGLAGDAQAIPTLRGILESDAKERTMYYAINAITRITKKDVRVGPVEEMDVERTRQKVLKMLRDR